MHSFSPELIGGPPMSSRKAIAKSSLQHVVAQPNPTLALRSESERQIRSTVDWSVSWVACCELCCVALGTACDGLVARKQRALPTLRLPRWLRL